MYERMPIIVALAAFMTMMTSTARGSDWPEIIPQPATMDTLDGTFRITANSTISVEGSDEALLEVASYLADVLETATGQRPRISHGSSPTLAPGMIVLSTSGVDPRLGPEGYELMVTQMLTMIRAPKPAGIFYGIQSLRQLLPPEALHGDLAADWSIPCVRIKDRPRYQWRGMLLDCGRHFMDVEYIKRHIDLLALHKMNVLHWHLTEDQGWRLQIEKYPKLTEIGAWRGTGDDRYGGYYTQDEVREIVAYAASRFVTVVPEIEMPGHCVAALAAYPELSCTGGPFEVSTRWGVHSDVYCAGSEAPFEFLENVLLEVFEMFPSTYIHIGGDECPKVRWEACDACQKRIEDEGLADEHELQSYFIARMERFINEHGRRIIGWDEILEGGLAPNATVQSWRGMNGAITAARAGHNVIASPTSHCYLDYSHDTISLEKIYSFEPTPAVLSPAEAQHILGAEGNMWTEYAPQERVDRMVYPRLSALAEVTWSPAPQRNWSDFRSRMTRHYRRLDMLDVDYFVSPPRATTPTRVFEDEVIFDFVTDYANASVHYTADGSVPSPSSPRWEGEMPIIDTVTFNAIAVTESGRQSEPVTIALRKLRPLEAVTGGDHQPGIKAMYYEGSWRQLPDFTALTPSETMMIDTFDTTKKLRPDQFGFRFMGLIEVPADGVYTFFLTSDDGSRLFIHDELIVSNDGLHGAVERHGQVILKQGRHPIIVEYFEAGGADSLLVEYEGPDVERQAVPAGALFH